jgi:hypothetical protein
VAKIEQLLHRRTDLSTFLVHLTRSDGDVPAREQLMDILIELRLRAGEPRGMASELSKSHQDVYESQRVVCFTETPLEHAWMMCEQIDGRQVKLEPYGIAVTKTWGRRNGVNPVMYIDITRGHDWLTKPIEELVKAAVAGHSVRQQWDGTWARTTLADSPILKITPFFEQMGKPGDIQKEFWWEREWRHVGDLTFRSPNLVVVFVPEDEHTTFISDGIARAHSQGYSVEHFPNLRLVDPRWGLERIVASLAAVAPGDIGPFPE